MQRTAVNNYIGRFAPSPTGPLHMGSLFAAVISYLDARANNGQWLVRIEDIDPPREVPGASQAILESLAAHGLTPDQTPQYQSQRSSLYEQRLAQLIDVNLCYHCPCSRKHLAETRGVHLPSCGKHRTYQSPIEASAIRFRTSNDTQAWHDVFRGDESSQCTNDFVLKRKDNLYAYQLAVVTDDIDQGITHVLRGEDLLDSCPMQLMLYKALGHPPPTLGHFPLVTNEHSQKLSKQNQAPAISNTTALENLRQVATWLDLAVDLSAQCPNTLIHKLTEQWASHSWHTKSHYLLSLGSH